MAEPKYQYSEFVNNGRNGQYVVRTDDKEEFEMLIAYVQSKIPKDPIMEATKDVQTIGNNPLGFCLKCKAPNITYKTGRVGCSKYCWRTV